MSYLAIKVEHAFKQYGDLTAVNDLSFEVNQGSCFGLLGPNGAGKTTMMKMLYDRTTRERSPKTDISVFGYDPMRDPLKVKWLTGIVPQLDNLDQELNVTQNLKLYGHFYGVKGKKIKSIIDELLGFMDMREKAKAPIQSLSGGMKRRLTIARALINSPKLLILDEPTTGLDPQVRHQIWDKLHSLKSEGVTILLTTHYMDEAFQLCDKLAIMHKGEKVLEGEPTNLLQDCIEPYVLELIHTTEKREKLNVSEIIRVEEGSHRDLYYGTTFKALEQLAKESQLKSYFIRQTNLEDLFLKITGRELNE